MDTRFRMGRRPASIAGAAFMITLFSAACSTATDPRDGYAETAYIEVTGTSPVPLLLVKSTNWAYEFDELEGEQQLVLFEADTVEFELPVSDSVALAPSYRILFRVVNPDTEQEADIRMRVHLDDELMFDQTATMRDASLEYSYRYF